MKISEQQKQKIKRIYEEVRKENSSRIRSTEWLLRETQRKAKCEYEDVLRAIFGDKR